MAKLPNLPERIRQLHGAKWDALKEETGFTGDHLTWLPPPDGRSEMAYGLSFGASIRNRSAQADNIRSQLERNQQEITLQSTKNQIQLQVQQARIALIQGREQVAAAREATRLAQVTLDAERVRLRNGLSTAYNVVLMERDLVTAQYAEVQVMDAYAKALVAMDQALGDTLEQNRIQVNEAITGTVTQRPSVPYHLPARTPGSNR